MTKDPIYNDIANLPIDELYKYIVEGTVTFDELQKNCSDDFAASKRKALKKLLDNADPNEWQKARTANTIEAYQTYLNAFPNGIYSQNAQTEIGKLKQAQADQKVATDWDAADKNDIAALREFIKKHPQSVYEKDAKKKIQELNTNPFDIESLLNKINEIYQDKSITTTQTDNNIVAEIENFVQKSGNKEQFLNRLKLDKNLLTPNCVNLLLDKGTIDYDDLLTVGIDNDFILEMQEKTPSHIFQDVPAPDNIKRQSSEIYFWGVPASGKSCALGAILSAANDLGMEQDNNSQGYGYMTDLIDIFSSKKIISLFGGTDVESFYEMGFTLTNNKKKHPITCIDMAGELMESLYLSDAKKKLTDEQKTMIEVMNKILTNSENQNRKNHVFVIEYGAENKKYKGNSQQTMLQGAMNYIRSHNVFKKNTDAVFIMVTKADKANADNLEDIKRYVNDNYGGFCKSLKQVCIDNEINNGNVEIIAFSLGEVCFQKYCRFDDKAAKNAVNHILLRTATAQKKNGLKS